MSFRHLIVLCSLAQAAGHAHAQDYEPPPAILPDAATQTEIGARTRRLSQAVEGLRNNGVRDPILADVEVHLKAAHWIDKHREYYHKDAGQWTLDVLDR